MSKKILGLSLVSAFVVLGSGVASASDYVASSTAVITSVLADTGSILFTGIASAFTLFASLIGLFFIVRLIRKYIGRGK